MHPLLKQCYEAAVGARQLASSFKSGEVGALQDRAHPFRRSVAADSASRPDQAAIQPAGIPLPARQQPGSRRISEAGRGRTRHCRRDRRGVGPARRLAAFHRRLSARRQWASPACRPRRILASRIFRAEQLLSRNYCEHAERLGASLRGHGINVDQSHAFSSERDLIELLEADIGVAVVPRSVSTSAKPSSATTVDGLDIRRTRAALRRRRTRAHRRSVGRDENAPGRRLVAISRRRSTLECACLDCRRLCASSSAPRQDRRSPCACGNQDRQSGPSPVRRGRPRTWPESAAPSRHCRESSACPDRTAAAGFRVRAISPD